MEKNLIAKFFQKIVNFAHFWHQIFEILKIFHFSCAHQIQVLILISKMSNMTRLDQYVQKWHFSNLYYIFCTLFLDNFEMQLGVHTYKRLWFCFYCTYLKNSFFLITTMNHIFRKNDSLACSLHRWINTWHQTQVHIFNENGGSTSTT